MTDVKKGTILDSRFELIEKIGRGGMAEVWAGKDTVLGRHVAVKIMLPQFSADENFVTRFKQEASSAANLSNPYIVNIYDWGHEDDIHYIVMEYVQGQDLKSLIQNKGILPCKSAAKVAAQVCQALATAHKQDIIHRDIKPQNIMIQPDGTVKVMDFGISRAKNSTEQKTQMVLGTAQYVSPEQAQGIDLTASSDIYSLGIVLYECVTGQPPFDGKDAVSVAIKQVDEEPIPPSHLNRNVDPYFEKIVLKALEKDPNDRYLSVQEMFADLESYANGRIDASSATTQLMNATPNSKAKTPASGDTTQVMPAASQKARNYTVDNNGNLDNKTAKQSEKKNEKLKIVGVVAGGIAILAAIIVAAVFFLLPNSVEVPDVVGKSEKVAIQMIENAGLSKGDITEVPSLDIPKGDVVSTDPSANEKVNKGTKVNIQVSSGPSKVKVPDLTGKTKEEAEAILKEFGLKGVEDSQVFSADVKEQCVAAQKPAKDTEVDAGSTVHYSISAGADTVTVPDLSGLTEEKAIEILKELGLEGLVGSRQPSETVPINCVVSQNPGKGTKIETGKQITFTVSTGPATVSMPSLTGLTQAAARSILINAKLQLGNITEEYSNEPKGSIIRQSVEDGTPVKEKTAIDIVISKGPQQTTGNTNTNTSTATGTASSAN